MGLQQLGIKLIEISPELPAAALNLDPSLESQLRQKAYALEAAHKRMVLDVFDNWKQGDKIEWKAADAGADITNLRKAVEEFLTYSWTAILASKSAGEAIDPEID